MNLSAKLDGLEDAMKAMMASFPQDAKKQRSMLNAGMRAAASKNILPKAKSLAMQGDGSGSLSEALAVRSIPLKELKKMGSVAGVMLVPVRFNRKAIAMYINYYYTQKGRAAPIAGVAKGIYHGHFVEFGSVNNNAKPFLFPAARSGQNSYIQEVGKEIKKVVDRNVNRARKK